MNLQCTTRLPTEIQESNFEISRKKTQKLNFFFGFIEALK
jgi:hypothetical protein